MSPKEQVQKVQVRWLHRPEYVAITCYSLENWCWGCVQKCTSTPSLEPHCDKQPATHSKGNTKPQDQWGSYTVAMSNHADVNHILPHIIMPPPRNWWTLACTMEIVPDPPVADMLLYKNVGLSFLPQDVHQIAWVIHIPVKHTCGTGDDKRTRSWTQK